MGCLKLSYYQPNEVSLKAVQGNLCSEEKTGAGTYLYGFNGKEKDDEGKGDGNIYAFGARIYDSRLGRWLSVDPKTSKYAGWSPYNFAICTPIRAKDPDGEDVYFVIYSGETEFYRAALTRKAEIEGGKSFNKDKDLSYTEIALQFSY